MPRQRQYRNRAEQQAAYRKRHGQAQIEQLAARHLPPLPALPTMPGRHRWQALLDLAQWATQSIAEEREQYFDDRSQTWQEGDRGQDFQAITEEVQETLDTIQGLNLNPI